MVPTDLTATFQLTIPVTEADIDALGHVNNVVYLRWVQEVSAAHWAQVAPAALQEKYLWVVLRHEIDFHKPAFREDTIKGYTWVGDYQGAKFERFVALYREGTELMLASAKTTWCLVDAKTLRPKRIDQEVVALL
ncbi:acyl-CoA thioesterase [Rufibacter glacialis]|uniref:Acyl-CoA thioesterase n=1 Tax=Rufibacter glacialis TaxID=1259555 RepID=A0A5M8QHK7_9BACT|nr:thioesterase family protein [Rufibacter glacialis]KAA6434631.1 acyl-CoA thioesterase [Rufibacter glacialis]GGK71198.1 thioesterase [Rufibacter glacialis]